MSLRKPKGIVYDMEIPALKKTIKFRPYKSGEQKEILTVIALKDTAAVVNKVIEIVEACTFGAVDVSNTPMYIVDQIFLQINSKANGSKQPANWECTNVLEATDEHPEGKPCGTKLPIMLDMDKAYLNFPEGFTETVIIDVDDEQKLKLRVPTFENFRKLDMTKDWMDMTTQFIFACVECIIDKDEIKVPGVDFTFEEAAEWIDELDTSVLDKIREFYERFPELVLDVAVTCPGCGKKDVSKLGGLEDFFA